MAVTDFMGQDGFVWFVGVVEDRQDPQKLGRVRVRCLGYHTENKEELPTADLPWAHPLLPITSSGISGIGQTPLGLLEGSWVVGFFRDAASLQDAIIMGSLPGKPTKTGAEEAATGLGVTDPNGIYPRYKNETDVNRLARGEENIPINVLRSATRLVDPYNGIPTASTIPFQTADLDTITTLSSGEIWGLPEIGFNSQYPYNHVFESESGHIFEVDDTPGAERLLQYHRSGTETEITADGSRTTIIKGADYNVTTGNSRTHITANKDVTLSGHYKIYLNADGQSGNNYDIVVGENANVNIQVDKGDINMLTIDGNINVSSGRDFNLAVAGTYRLSAGAIEETSFTTTTRTAQGRYHTFGSPIDHN